jgi:L-lactate utilization protein LutC
VEREAFLAGLRQALAAAPPHAASHPPAPPPAVVPRPRWPPDSRSLSDRFGAALAAVQARLVRPAELPAALAELEVRSAVVSTDAVSLPPTIERLGPERARAADAGVTAAVAACAATGTVVLAASPNEPRAASLLPRVHVVAVAANTLVESPGEVLRDLHRRYPDGLPSALTLVTGPSRSADIGGEIVLGVHGPLAVLVVLVEQEVLP